MKREPDDLNERIRRELIGHRVCCPPLEIRLHHFVDDDTCDILIWARLTRQDGTEAFAVLSPDDGWFCEAVWPKATIWMTRLRTERKRLVSHAEEFSELKKKSRSI